MIVDQAECRASSGRVNCHSHSQHNVNAKNSPRYECDEDADRPLPQQQRQQQPQHRQEVQRRDEEQQHGQEEITELEEFLRYRTDNNRETVAEEMTRSYEQLFDASQEPQEFISLEELGTHVHQPQHSREESVSTSNTSAHLYPANHNQQNTGAQQQRTYYNLSSAIQDNPCITIHFGNMGESSGTGDVLPPASTPAQSSGSGVTATGSSTVIGSTTDGSSVNNNNNDNSTNGNNIGVTENDNSLSATAQGSETASPMEINLDTITEHESGYHRHHQRSVHRLEVDDALRHSTASELSNDTSPVSRKRKVSCHDENDILTDDGGDGSKFNRPNSEIKKQNHSEIEKRRRDKMNTYITELSAMIPMCHAMSRKLDKLTVLRMAVQHLKTILGAVTSYTEGHYKPTFLSDQELKTLILQTAEGFVFVVGCDRGRILYVSESVSQTLNYTQKDLLGQSYFDILHPKDVAKVKEQLSSSDLSPRERLIDAKTMLPVKTDVPQGVSRLCPGARRSFFCRMKRKVDGSGLESQVKEEADTTTGCHRRKKQQNVDWKYCVIHCTGYLKSWAPATIGVEEKESDADGDGEGCNLSCLVAVGRVQPGLPALTSGPTIPKLRTIEFISRHAIDGKFLFVDQRSTLVLGFLPQELLGTSMYEYYHRDDIPHLSDSHKAALQSPEGVTTRVYRFKTKSASFVKLQSAWKSFRNPWTKDIEYLIAKNSAIYCDTRQVESSVNRSEGSGNQDNCDYFAQSTCGLDILISSHVEMSKIGRRIAEEVLDNQKRVEDSCSASSTNAVPERTSSSNKFQITTTASPGRVADLPQEGVSIDNNRSNQTPTYNLIRDNGQLNSIANDQGAQSDENMMDMIGGTVTNESTNPLPSDGNDETAMAVIMSLLEADAGLGGPVDFSGLPWPLP